MGTASLLECTICPWCPRTPRPEPSTRDHPPASHVASTQARHVVAYVDGVRLSAWVFHAVSVKDYVWVADDGRRSADWYERSTGRFLQRFEGRIDLHGASVLDVGCGTGDMAAILARDGA